MKQRKERIEERNTDMKIVTRVHEKVSISVLTDDALGEKKRQEMMMIKTHLHRTNQTNKRKKREKTNRKTRGVKKICHYRTVSFD